MKRKVFITLIFIVLSLAFAGEVCFAKLSIPTDSAVLTVGEGSAKVGWQWSSKNGGTINRFVLSYRIETTYSPISGTVTVTQDSPEVVGTNTFFTTALTSGTFIKIEENILEVSSITDDLHLTLGSPYPGPTTSGARLYKVVSWPWTKRYPSAEVREYTITALTENTSYEWTIMAEAVNPADNSEEASGPFFTTLSGSVDGGKPPGNGGEPPGNGLPGLTNPLKADTLEEAINALINFLFVLVMGLAPLMIVYAAFLILASAGDPTKVNRGKQVILWTVVALAVVLFAKGLPAVIKAALGG